MTNDLKFTTAEDYMNETIIIEDTISRNKKFQEERKLRVNALKKAKVSVEWIEYEEMISKMTLAEYNIYLQQLEEEFKKNKLEYAKNNPIQKSIVDEIYDRESKLKYDYWAYSTNVHWLMAINPLGFISREDFENDLYITFLEHAKEIYKDRFKEEFEKEDRFEEEFGEEE
jgi:hypothetical protein